MLHKSRSFALWLLVTVPAPLEANAADKERFLRRWVYTHPGFDLREDDETQQLVTLIGRAKKAGYNGVCISTGRLELMQIRHSDAFYQNIERVRRAAEEMAIELIPRVMQINGYSNGILSNNPT
jgi:hypothetical protein